MNITRTTLALAATAAVAFGGQAIARDNIRIVGSSTVFPFATAVAERFATATGNPAPVVESTGSGGGLRLFCEGVGTETPDVTNASRRMKTSEFDTCNENGVDAIVEVVVGYDGIVIANARSGQPLSLTREQVYLALATAETGGAMPTQWSDIDPSLPAIDIVVYGPPPSSGTRDAFEELALQKGCRDAGNEKDYCKGVEIRTDGAYVEAGENDNLIVSRLEAEPNAYGVFGFSFLDQNASVLQGAQVGDVAPTIDAIASGDYPLSRSMYFYVKKAHIGVVPGIVEYISEFVSPSTSGDGGYLSGIGLIPLPAATHASNRSQALSLTELTREALQ